MVISSIRAGLGNQLFQYSMGRRLAAMRGVPLKLDLSWFCKSRNILGMDIFPRHYRLHEFNIKAEIATPEEIDHFTIVTLNRLDVRRVRGVWWRFVRNHLPPLCKGMRIYEHDLSFDSKLLRLPGDVYLEGWWQSERYFRDFTDPIRNELTLRNSMTVERVNSDLNSYRKKNRPLVAIQVRRGDVARAHEVTKELTYMPYKLVSQDYLHNAMATFGRNATFIVFSETPEDINWCRDHLNSDDIHFMNGNDDLYDFVAMSRCDHNIISNSSFGWWAAWLNPNPAKIIVAPRRWFRPEYAPTFDIRSLIPHDWIIL